MIMYRSAQKIGLDWFLKAEVSQLVDDINKIHKTRTSILIKSSAVQFMKDFTANLDKKNRLSNVN